MFSEELYEDTANSRDFSVLEKTEALSKRDKNKNEVIKVVSPVKLIDNEIVVIEFGLTKNIAWKQID